MLERLAPGFVFNDETYLLWQMGLFFCAPTHTLSQDPLPEPHQGGMLS